MNRLFPLICLVNILGEPLAFAFFGTPTNWPAVGGWFSCMLLISVVEDYEATIASIVQDAGDLVAQMDEVPR